MNLICAKATHTTVVAFVHILICIFFQVKCQAKFAITVAEMTWM